MTHPTDQFSWRFDQALTLASLAHAGIPRKGTAVPYIMHPAHVARLLERHGFSEDVVIAGLLHDVLEDAQFGHPCLQSALRETFSEFAVTEPSEVAFRGGTETFIAAKFGENVLELVRSVTETKSDGAVKRPWRVRKDQQLAHISGMNGEQAALKAADTLHNCQSVLQLLHGLAGTLIEARRRAADVAVFLVQVFTSDLTQTQKLDRNATEVLAFVELLQLRGSDPLRTGHLAGPYHPGAASALAVPIPFYLGLLHMTSQEQSHPEPRMTGLE